MAAETPRREEGCPSSFVKSFKLCRTLVVCVWAEVLIQFQRSKNSVGLESQEAFVRPCRALALLAKTLLRDLPPEVKLASVPPYFSSAGYQTIFKLQDPDHTFQARLI